MAYVSLGFEPVSNNATPFAGRTEIFYMPTSDTTDTAIFDIVKLATGVAAGLGIPTCARITGVNDVPIGVVVGFVADPSYLEQTYRTGATARIAIVDTSPSLEMLVQEDNAGAATLAASRLGAIVDPVVGSVDTVSGTSGMQISSAAATGSPGMLRLQRLSEVIGDPAIGGTNTKWVVTFNVHRYKVTS